MGNLDSAQVYTRQAWHLRQTQLGDTHPDTLISLNNLGVILARMEQLDEAHQLLAQCLHLRRVSLGEKYVLPSPFIVKHSLLEKKIILEKQDLSDTNNSSSFPFPFP
jgi:Tfp pilus assembly protein PilF